MNDQRQDLHGAVPAERAAPPLSLYEADAEQVNLFALREECQTDEERAEIDKLLKAYVGSELEKVTPLTALFACFKNNAAAGRSDEERIQKDRNRWQGRYDLLKAFVFDDMIARGKALVTSAAARFRLQDNPIQAKITDASLIEEKYMIVSVVMPYLEWKRLTADHHDYARYRRSEIGGGEAIEQIKVTSASQAVNYAALKEALLVRIPCKDCKGSACKRCGGETSIAAKVPGAELSRTQHLRIE